MSADNKSQPYRVILPDGKTCGPCNSILVDESSFSILFATEDLFEYRRNYDDLISTSTAGCILCTLLLERHQQYGPNPTDEFNCTSECRWSDVEIRREVLFLVGKKQCEPQEDSQLRCLQFRGQRKDHSQGNHGWELILEASAEQGMFICCWEP